LQADHPEWYSIRALVSAAKDHPIFSQNSCWIPFVEDLEDEEAEDQNQGMDDDCDEEPEIKYDLEKLKLLMST